MHCFEAEKDVEILGCLPDGAGPTGARLTLGEGLQLSQKGPRLCRLRPSEQGRPGGRGMIPGSGGTESRCEVGLAVGGRAALPVSMWTTETTVAPSGHTASRLEGP